MYICVCITITYELPVIIHPHLTDRETEAERGPVICPSSRASVKRKSVNLVENLSVTNKCHTEFHWSGCSAYFYLCKGTRNLLMLVGSSNFMLSSKALCKNNSIYYFENKYTSAPAPSCVVRLETMPPVALCTLPSHYSPSLEHNHFLCCPKVSLQGTWYIVSAVSAYSV